MWRPRQIEESESEEFRSRVSQAFGRDLDDDPEAAERFARVFELDRTVAVFDQKVIVGTGAAFTFDLTVPGGTLPMGGTTIITVRPTHRRRGVLNAMMRYHLDEVISRGEPIAGLWASEGGIYARYGYGVASMSANTTVAARSAQFVGESVTHEVDLLEEDEARPHLEAVYSQVRHEVPGMFTRNDDWWSFRVLGTGGGSPGKYSARRFAVARTTEAVEGYAIYRQKLDWSSGTPEGETSITEMMTTTAGSRRALWEYLVNIDLFQTVRWWNMPIDDPLAAMLADSRAVSTDHSDALWLRLLDIPRSLAGRSYERDGSLNIGITDGFLHANNGTYRLEVVNGRATCVRTEEVADVVCEVDVLAHLYLGGGNAINMAAAGRLAGSADDVRLLNRVFRTDRQPWCPEAF